MSKCPQCGKYLRNVHASVTAAHEILRVDGHCKRHGLVQTDDWEYWDFYPAKEGPDTAESEGEFQERINGVSRTGD